MIKQMTIKYIDERQQSKFIRFFNEGLYQRQVGLGDEQVADEGEEDLVESGEGGAVCSMVGFVEDCAQCRLAKRHVGEGG